MSGAFKAKKSPGRQGPTTNMGTVPLPTTSMAISTAKMAESLCDSWGKGMNVVGEAGNPWGERYKCPWTQGSQQASCAQTAGGQSPG